MLERWLLVGYDVFKAGYRPQTVNKYFSRVLTCRNASSSSNRWQSRQGKDRFTKDAKVQGLKSRAAFKLLEVLKSSKVI
jgi:hypothetical protein